MIHSLIGKITYKDNKSLVLENQGIGYKIFCSPDVLKKTSEGQELKLFTHLHVKEDAVELYGFLALEELKLFDILNEISGIGPKTALTLASLGSLEKLQELMENGKLPPEVKGIGPKKAQKILLELTGKIKEIRASKEAWPDDGSLDALASLGFPRQKAREALSKVRGEANKEEKIKEALRILGGV